LTYDPSNVSSDGLLVLRSSNIGDGILEFQNNVFVDMEVPERIIVRQGDLLICVRNGSRPLIGKCALIDKQAEGMTFGAFMSVFRSPHNRFVFYCFQSDLVKRQIHEQLGATINQITNRSLNSFWIPFPDAAEQDLIAGALWDVDGLIGALEKLIAKKRAIKLAAMQQLLTGKTRLPGFGGEWTSSTLGDIGSFSKGRGIKRDEVSDDGVACVRYGELYTRYYNYLLNPVARIPKAVARTALPIKKGDILFAGSGETAEEIGRCAAYLGEDEACAGGDVVVLTPLGQNSLYLGHLMNHETVTTQKARLGQGDAVVHISARNLAQVGVKIPPVDEQDAIATVLLDMDVEIAALERRRDKMKQIKQGMMQQLLTGRIRLVNREAKA
jgi:type I restriction enzyme S subunit